MTLTGKLWVTIYLLILKHTFSDIYGKVRLTNLR